MGISEIMKRTGWSEWTVRDTLARALWKFKRGMQRLGIDASYIVGKPLAMAARGEEQ